VPSSPESRLHALLASLPDALVAYSGGIDSSVLLHAAVRALPGRVTALIGDSPALPRRELADARAFAAALTVPLEVLSTDELEAPGYVANDGRRCYFCRHTLFTAMADWGRRHGHATLLYGEILDDRLDDRPGRLAAAELEVRAPLAEAGFTKADVRSYARAHGLALAEKPAAACLASRLPIGTPVTAERLARIEAAEERLHDLDFGTLRVRDLGTRARVEVAAERLDHARALAPELRARLVPLGFTELELAAYVVPTQRPPAKTPPA
jgi:uncharacterized protein